MLTQFVALLDSSVMYASPLRDLLLQLASTGLYRGRWTDRIHDEWTSNLLKNRPDILTKQLEYTRKKINESVLNCLVTDFEPLIDGLILPDPNDRHVLAAAIHAKAQVIITYNIKDFPKLTLARYDIEPQHPDTFLKCQLDLFLPRVLSCVRTIRCRLKNPPKTTEEYLAILTSQNLPQTASILKQYADLI